MIIQLDLDGTTHNMAKKFSEHLGLMYPESSIPTTGPDDCPKYQWHEWLPQVTREMEEACWLSLSKMPRWWEDLECLLQPAQIARLNALIHDGHHIYAATGRPPVNANEDVQMQTISALYRVGLLIDDVCVGVGDKAAFAWHREADISIEDYGPHALALNDIPGHTAVLLNRPYNVDYQKVHMANGGVVVHSFDEFLALCERKAKEA